MAQADFLFDAGVIGWISEVHSFADQVTEAEEMLFNLRHKKGLLTAPEPAVRESDPQLFDRLTEDRQEGIRALQELHCQLKDTFSNSLGNR
jgi:hypothetical protein